MPQSSRPLFRIAMFGALAAAFMLAGCGRKGPLDPPPGSSIQQPSDEAQPGANDPALQTPPVSNDIWRDGRANAPRGQKKKLPGDILID